MEHSSKKLRVLDFFAGVGAFDSALDRLGVQYELVDAVEIDKYAMAAFNAIHGTNFECQDITKWDKDVGHIDIMWQSSPCQDLSVAGKQGGAERGSGTRSSLVWEVIRIVEKVRPKVVIWENVKGLVSKKNHHILDGYIEELDKLGYRSSWKVLNSKNFLIPQNRERCFTVSILGGGDFCFPEDAELIWRLKDILEADVDEKFYLSQERVEKIKFSTFHSSNYASRVRDPNGESRTLAARDYKDPTCVQVGTCEAINGNDILKRIYSADGIAPTCNTCGGGNTETKIIDPQGRKNKVNTPKDISPTLRAQDHGNPPMAIVDDTYANRDARLYDDSAPTLRSERSGLKVVVGDNQKPIEETPAVIQKQGDRGTNNYSVSSETSYTIPANPMSDRDQKVVEPFIVASRGRNPDNPSDRTTGVPTEQRLEAHTDGVSNTLTSVQKDNYVGEPMPKLRVRKLTPREYFRLQGFTDKEFDKAAKVNSNSRLYKAAGNSVTVSVICALLSQLGVCDKKWNDMTNEERQRLVASEMLDK